MARVNDPELTKARLHLVVEEMYDRIVKGDPPTMTLPVRAKNNIGFDRKLGVYKYGKKTINKRCYKPWFCEKPA